MTKPEDPLLRALGELEREEYEQAYPTAWESVLTGKTSATEAAAERAQVDPPELRAVYEAMFTGPLAETDVQAMVDRVAATTKQATSGRGGEVVRPRFGRGVVIGIAAVLAIAAALVLWRLPGEAPRGTAIAYSLTVRNPGLHSQRTGEEPDDRYRPDATVDWVVSPALTNMEAVELRVLARDAAGAVRVLAPPATRSPEGVLRLRGRFAELLPLAPGRWQLRFVVVAAGAALKDEAAVTTAVARGQAWEVREGLEITVLRAAGQGGEVRGGPEITVLPEAGT